MSPPYEYIVAPCRTIEGVAMAIDDLVRKGWEPAFVTFCGVVPTPGGDMVPTFVLVVKKPVEIWPEQMKNESPS